ncbi:MAG: hypothetical protein GDA41_09600 [Rhodospirillales bacterium]|nr:hypothetical protein [Rhodospirillales bacterium]
MKVPQILLAAVLALVSYGHPSAIKADDSALKHDACERLEEVAREIMTHRQNGASVSSVMKMVTDMPESEKLSELLRSWVIYAYQFPRKVSFMRKDAIKEFGNKIALNCYQGMYD